MADPIQDVLQAFTRGELVVVTDDDDREGEGDLIIAASLCTADKMAFIIRHTSGIVCAPITTEDARRLRLDPMVAHNESNHTTAFTVSIDYKPDGGTGISADERASCCRALANPNAGANDFARPGHVFPLIARDGGVLMRSGHTEAAVDLCKLAGLPPVGVICELANDDGSVMTGEQITQFALQHRLTVISVADLIAHRQSREKLVERVATFPVETSAGALTGYAYVTPYDSVQHFAFVLGSIGDGRDMPARLHRADIIGDVFGGAETIKKTLARFAREGRGVLVYLRDGAAGVPANVVRPREENAEENRRRQWFDVGLGAQILKDLGVSSIRLRSTTPKPRAYVGLSGFGIEITAVEPVE